MIHECLFREDKDRTGPPLPLQQCKNGKVGSGMNENRVLRGGGAGGEVFEEPALQPALTSKNQRTVVPAMID